MKVDEFLNIFTDITGNTVTDKFEKEQPEFNNRDIDYFCYTGDSLILWTKKEENK